ncbi:flagellar protein FlaG [Shewanella sp. ULN5]|uniref:flagellar protein FlaG n=1 Tax=Shewanella sp. ULN5 TaxID=2994678 RepID=UPI00273F7DD2|nr:flagellar protein FlaG [Shewanella sp. ULN5]MDP5144968.1 flagellar protein FlaG [Shewanella sp. ULN5]
MEIHHNNSTASFLAQADVTKNGLDKEPLALSKGSNLEATIKRASSIQAVKEASESKEPKGNKDKPNDQELNQVAKDLTDMMSMMQKGLKFSVDKESGQQVIKVQDIASGDIIRQIPSEEALLLAEKLSEVSGILMRIEV